MILEYNEDEWRINKGANSNKLYKQCSVSVMDTISDPNIQFDEKGISNYYYEYKKAHQMYVKEGEEGERTLNDLFDKIHVEGKGNQYDCIMGVSGGVDSTYLAFLAKKHGLRPLLVHFDNGWNSELAIKNIENIISKLKFDLFTLVVQWEEFRDIQLSYLKASVVDIEVITDHAILGTLYRLAMKHNIKYILSGTNVVTEQVLPSHWIWKKTDHVNIKDIHSKFGSVPLKTFPLFTTKEKQLVKRIRNIKIVSPLNNVEYNKDKIKTVIKNELSWRDYGGKHYESIWTRFYQGYILPAKFGIDKRKAHLSNLIFSGQITKQQAVEILKEPIYPSHLFSDDYEFVLKKLKMSSDEFQELIKLPRREHTDFKFEVGIKEKIRSAINTIIPSR